MRHILNIAIACICGINGVYTVFAQPIEECSGEQICIEGNPESHSWEGSKCTKCYCAKSDEIEDVTVLSKQMLEPNGIKLSGDIVIPETINVRGKKKTVIGIAQNLFAGNQNITSVHLPDTIVDIKDFAFDSCSNLQCINLPDGLEVIGEAAFQLCTSLKEVTIPDSVVRIDDFAFNHCPAIQGTSFKIPASIKRLGYKADAPTHTFYDFGTDMMSEFLLDSKNKYYKTENGILYSKDGSLLISIPNGKTFENNTYIMPDSVKELGELSFGRNKNIKTLVISDNLNVDDKLTSNQCRCFQNRGNKLNIGIYGYCSVERYETKLSNKKYKSQDGILYDIDMNSIIAIPCQYNGVINIPEGVTTWNKDALWVEYVDYFGDISLNKISQINIPSSMSYINESQLNGLNHMHDVYQTKFVVEKTNKFYKVENGYLKKI